MCSSGPIPQTSLHQAKKFMQKMVLRLILHLVLASLFWFSLFWFSLFWFSLWGWCDRKKKLNFNEYGKNYEEHCKIFLIFVDWSAKEDCVYIKMSPNQCCLKDTFRVIQKLETKFATYTCLKRFVWSENM